MIQGSYTPDLEDLVEASVMQRRRLLLGHPFRACLAVLLFVGGGALVGWHLASDQTVALRVEVAVLIAVLPMAMMLWKSSRSSLRGQIGKSVARVPAWGCEVKVELTGEGLRTDDGKNQSVRAWSSFLGWAEHANRFFLESGPMHWVVLPHRAFRQEDLADVRKTLETMVKSTA